MPKLTVNGQEIEVEAGLTVLQACEMAGAEIPRFCYHERLAIAGNCRMCLVEMERAPKPIASCAMPVAEGMVIHTDTEKVKKAREGVMEFLLINHPLDCPICDQGGECDLQDQAMMYGFDRSRYKENKRAVRDKDLGPLVKTIMTRCIHCTRCIRFATEVAGVPELGATGRGEHMEVGTYVEKTLTSELSGNIVDLCPVGALTNKPYAFHGRPWELQNTESIDVMDAMGSHIRVDFRGREVMRVLPRINDDINEEWISDKTRHAIDGLKYQRLDRPYVRRKGKLEPASWDEAFQVIAKKVKKAGGKKVAAIAGDLMDCESMMALKDLMKNIGSPNMDCRQDGAALENKVRAGYLFNTSIAGIEDADALLIIGADPRWEASVLNSRIRKRYLMGGFPIGYIGPKGRDLTYQYEHLGDDPTVLEDILAGKNKFAKTLKDAERPMLILGMSALTRPDGKNILGAARKIANKFNLVSKDWNGFNVLHTAASRVGGLDLGFLPGKGGKDTNAILKAAKKGNMEVVYLLGADEIDTDTLKDAFVIYQGHHGDAGAHVADVILPGAAYTEKDGTYVNLEGRVQDTWRSVFPPGDAREDWTIIRALSEHVGRKKLPYDSLAQLRERMVKENKVFAEPDVLPNEKWKSFGGEGKLKDEPFTPYYRNFYMTNAICRSSPVMAKCTMEILGRGDEEEELKTGTDG